MEVQVWKEGSAGLSSIGQSSPIPQPPLPPPSISCTIDLPWKPRLAAAGGTTHVFSPRTGKIVRHIERWDVEIDRVLKSLLVPANRLPTNR